MTFDMHHFVPADARFQRHAIQKLHSMTPCATAVVAIIERMCDC